MLETVVGGVSVVIGGQGIKDAIGREPTTLDVRDKDHKRLVNEMAEEGFEVTIIGLTR